MSAAARGGARVSGMVAVINRVKAGKASPVPAHFLLPRRHPHYPDSQSVNNGDKMKSREHEKLFKRACEGPNTPPTIVSCANYLPNRITSERGKAFEERQRLIKGGDSEGGR